LTQTARKSQKHGVKRSRRRYLESVARLADIVFDCERPASPARWWASTLDGYRVAPYDSAELKTMVDPEGNEFCITCAV
jgi:purine nucleoside permease